MSVLVLSIFTVQPRQLGRAAPPAASLAVKDNDTCPVWRIYMRWVVGRGRWLLALPARAKGR